MIQQRTHHNVQSSKLLHSSINGSLDFGLLAHIGLECENFGIGQLLGDISCDFLSSLEVDVGQNDAGAFLREQN